MKTLKVFLAFSALLLLAATTSKQADASTYVENTDSSISLEVFNNYGEGPLSDIKFQIPSIFDSSYIRGMNATDGLWKIGDYIDGTDYDTIDIDGKYGSVINQDDKVTFSISFDMDKLEADGYSSLNDYLADLPLQEYGIQVAGPITLQKDSYTSGTAVPAPKTGILFATGLICFAGVIRNKSENLKGKI